MRYNGFSVDAEADDLIFGATTIWTLWFEDLDTGERMHVNPFKDSKAREKVLAWVRKYAKPNIAFHNGLGYDIFVLKFILGIDFTVGPDTFDNMEVNFVDTFYLSMYLNPDRERHGIEHFGKVLGFPKMDFRQACIDAGVIPKDAPKGAEFKQYTPIMEEYCEQDTNIGAKTFKYLINEWIDVYGGWEGWTPSFKAGQKSFFLMSCQELSGWKFDRKAGEELVIRIQQMMEEIRAEVEPKLPPRTLKKTEEKDYKMPTKPYKANGDYSAQWTKFVEKHRGKETENPDVWIFYGKKYKIEANKILDIEMPMEMGNQDQMKEWFLSSGWEPTLWNYKKDSAGKPIRDPDTRQLIPTSPKIQEAGKLCANLEEMEGEIVRQVVKWLSLRNRLSVLEGWLSNERLEYDGRIGAGRTGIAATHRQKHQVVVNVPKADPKVLLGYEFRALWTSEEGFMIAAGDAAVLEGRVQGHYCYKYDNGATAEELLKGDAHSKNAYAFYGDIHEEVAELYNAPDFDKEDKRWKPYRSKSKNGYYCLPMDTKVLTQTGWKYFNEISEGESLPTFNENTGFVEMDKVLAKHKYTDTEVFKFSNKRDSFRCTDNHRWYGWRRSKSRSRPSYNVYGYFEANQFTQEHNLLLTAPFIGGNSKVTEDEALLLGLIASDGSITWSEDTRRTSSSHGNRRAVALTISQSINKFYLEIEEVLERLGLKYSKYLKEVENLNNIWIYKISQPDAWRYLDKVLPGRLNKHEVNWTEFVISLTRESLLAFYHGFYLGDGEVCSRSTGISQNLGNLFDGIVTATQLLGLGRVSINEKGQKSPNCKFIRMQNRKHMTMQEQRKESDGVQDTFCLTTGNGSFIIWQDDFIGITGNCIMYGGGASKVASTLGIPEKYGKKALDAFWEANPGTKALKENLEAYWNTTGQKKYLPAIDGRILLTRKKSALLNTIFQSCGGIVMDYAGCFMDKWLGEMHWDEKRRPYYVYKGYIVRRIGYFHDELEYECQEPIAGEVARMIERAIATAGNVLKLKVPLVGEGKVGKTWREVH